MITCPRLQTGIVALSYGVRATLQKGLAHPIPNTEYGLALELPCNPFLKHIHSLLQIVGKRFTGLQSLGTLT